MDWLYGTGLGVRQRNNRKKKVLSSGADLHPLSTYNLALWSATVRPREGVRRKPFALGARPSSARCCRLAFQLCWTGRFLTNPFMSLENVCLISDCEQVLWGRMESLL